MKGVAPNASAKSVTGEPAMAVKYTLPKTHDQVTNRIDRIASGGFCMGAACVMGAATISARRRDAKRTRNGRPRTARIATNGSFSQS